MAKFIERPTEEDEEYEQLEPEAEETFESEPEQPEQPEEVTAEVEEDIPEKYRGKSRIELAKMHQEAEKLLGRHSSEVGELRHIVDSFVKTQLEQQKQSPQAQDEPEIDFFDDPDAYIERKLASHPKLKEAEMYTAQARQAATLSTLQQNHPDYLDIIQDEKFGEWIMSSKVRQQLYNLAHNQYDYDAADELLSLWKERQSIVKQTEVVQKQDRKNQAKAAATGKATGSGEPNSRKIYRRADIIKLMQTDPKRYAQLSDELMAAYAEGRVR